MADCLLCGCDEAVHTPRFLNPLRPCESWVLLSPPTLILPEGHTEDCGCPGYETDEEDIA